MEIFELLRNNYSDEIFLDKRVGTSNPLLGEVLINQKFVIFSKPAVATEGILLKNF